MSFGYEQFAQFYDRLTGNVDYDSIAMLVHELVQKYADYKEVILDLACGTGSLSEKLAQKGYDVVGVDNSPEMLEIALQKFEGKDLPVTLLQQDMTELELYGAVDCTVCILDSFNHLSDKQQLQKAFERVSMFTCDGGLFVFDLNTEYKHKQVLADNAFNFDNEDCFCAWQNELADDASVHIYLDFFQKDNDGRYTRYSDDFTEILFENSFIENELKQNGFELIGKYDDFSLEPVKETSQRVLWVCKKTAKK
ncbi:class I SAM-dependent methyltransferase [Ruminococcus sp. FC2018]|uniref:class I SAM-dependent DNA methyltransferase n=1 Tax=Ruminococcus sp. FC2018 TaxID=1410617 RepID=UPI00048B6A20|nr:class I SAM-dependent methyltransferase [Ruminococcus sp. FC2018]